MISSHLNMRWDWLFGISWTFHYFDEGAIHPMPTCSPSFYS